MKKNKIRVGYLSILLLSPVALAMQPMDDQSLAQTTGQDGINIGVNVSKAQINTLAVIDRDGLGSTINDSNKASLVVSGTNTTAADQNFSISFLGANNTSSTLNMVMDTDGGSGKPFANIGLTFGSNITGIKISPFALYVASASSTSSPSAMNSIFTGASQKANVVKLLEMKNGLDINFAASKPKVNLQLGNMPQSRLIILSGAIQSICGTGGGCPINFVSDNGNVGASFNFQLVANDKTNGFALDGFYAGVEPTGLVFGNTGESSKFDLGINQLMMGTSSAIGANFNGLQNGSMGNIGAVGASVTDLKMKISGL